jgi:hypothetical protein
MRALILIATLGAAGAASATSQPPRFAVNATATLTPDAPAQSAASFRLRATLSPVTDAATAPPAQRSGGFSLVAWADAVATACYDDTIFRDDFDGDGS